MKTGLIVLLALLLTVPLGVRGIQAEPANSNQPSTVPQGPQLVTEQSAAPATGQPNAPAPGGDDILAQVEKMVNAGTQPDVIKAFIETWPRPFAITADNVLHLHDVGAPTDVLTTLIRRSAQLQAQATPPGNPPSAPPAGESGTNAPAVLYPYPSSAYPPYSYSYLYPNSLLPDTSYTYSYWAAPYPYWYGFTPYFSFYWWPSYRYYGWYRHPFYRPGYPFGYRHPGGWGGWGRPGFGGGGWRGGGGFGHGSFGHGGRR